MSTKEKFGHSKSNFVHTSTGVGRLLWEKGKRKMYFASNYIFDEFCLKNIFIRANVYWNKHKINSTFYSQAKTEHVCKVLL